MTLSVISVLGKMKRIFLFAAALLAFAACEDTSVDDTPKGDEISVAPEKKTFGPQGGSQQVVVSSTGDWTLTKEDGEEWISSDITSGSDGDIVTFDVQANSKEQEFSSVYTFRCGEATATFTAILSSSEAKTLELVSPSEVEVPYTTEEIQVQFSTNANYRALEASVSSDADDWLSYRVSLEGDEAGVVTMVFTLLPNEGRDNRSGVITVSAGEQGPSVDVNVIQRAQPVITPEKSEYVLDLAGEELSIPVDANIEYDVDITYEEGTDAWLEHKGNRDGAEVFSAGASETNRYATVLFTESDPIEGIDPLVVSVKVRQTPPPVITKALDMTRARAYPPKWSAATKSALTEMQEFTLEALVKAETFKSATGSLSTIMGREGHFLVRVGDAGIDSDRLQVVASSKVEDPNVTLDTGEWYHIAVTMTYPAHVVVYLNGESVLDGYCQTTSVTFGVDHTSYESDYFRNFWVGYSYDANRDFRGLMSELRIWDRALTGEEINAENHFYTVDPESEGLLCYWKLNEGEGNTFKDYTGNGNDLTGEINVGTDNVTAGAQWVDVSLPE